MLYGFRVAVLYPIVVVHRDQCLPREFTLPVFYRRPLAAEGQYRY